MGVGPLAPLSADDAAALVDIMTVKHAHAGDALFCRNDDLKGAFRAAFGRRKSGGKS